MIDALEEQGLRVYAPRAGRFLEVEEAIAEEENTTIYQYNELQIEQKYLPPADWEFVTKDSRGKIVDKTWWGYEDGEINIGIYIENFLNKVN